MFLITGDNWACGSWGRSDPSSSIKLMSRGLSECLDDKKSFNVPNISLGQRNQGNFAIIKQLQNWLEQNPNWDIKYILFFLADHSRDIQVQGSYTHSVNSYYRELESKLTDVINQTQLPLWLIGGTSDVPQQLVDAVPTACQSFTNWLLNDQPDIDQPVLSTTFSKLSIDSWNHVNTDQEQQQLLADIAKGEKRQQQWQNDQKYFFPDKQNPNLAAHVKLFWLIKEKLKFLG